MIILFYDIGIKYSRDLIDSRFDHMRFNEVLYINDIFLVSKNTTGMNQFLHAIEEESTYYGFTLNHDKCNVLAMNGHNIIRFRDGSQIRHADEVIYLGGVLTKQVNIASEICSRIASAMAWKSLDIFWKEA